MQHRRVAARPSLDTSKAYGWIIRVIPNYYHNGITFGPAGLLDYLIDDRSDIHGLMHITYVNPI
jgi:hypothetical protein